MKIQDDQSDSTILAELGARLAGARLAINLTQAELAEQAGVSPRTVARLESGLVGTQLSGFIRVCRVLGLVERLDLFVPEAVVSPMAQLKLKSQTRKRASRKDASREVRENRPSIPWTWSDPE